MKTALSRGVVVDAIALILVVTLASCGNEGSQTTSVSPQPTSIATKGRKKVKIAIVVNAISPFWDPMRVGMERASKLLGCEATWRGPTNALVSEQKRILEDYVSQGVDAISISPIDAKAIAPVIDEIQRNGIIVITMDSDAPGTLRKAYIGTNNYEAGREAGRQAVKILGEKGGKVVAFVGTLAAQNAIERLNGFKDATKDHNIEVVDVKQDQTDKSKARANAEDAIQSFPKINAFLGLWSYNGPAIAQAVKDAGKRDQIKIICFDAEPATLEHLKKGEIDVTIVQKPYLFGYLSVMVLYNMVTCGVDETLAMLPHNGIIDTGVEAITPHNVEAYLEKLKKLGIKSS